MESPAGSESAEAAAADGEGEGEGEEAARLDLEFRKHLHLLRPYLMNMVEEDATEWCGAWVERLTRCAGGERERRMRNRCLLELSRQLSRGWLRTPFTAAPPDGDLADCFAEDDSSCDSAELSGGARTPQSEEYQSCPRPHHPPPPPQRRRDHTRARATSRSMLRSSTSRDLSAPPPSAHELSDEALEGRAATLLLKLRDIKQENVFLNDELAALKDEVCVQQSSVRHYDDENVVLEEAVQSCPHAHGHAVAAPAQESEDGALQQRRRLARARDSRDSRRLMQQAVTTLQQRLRNSQHLAALEMEEAVVKHKLELSAARAACNRELAQLKQEHADLLQHLSRSHTDYVRELERSSARDLLELAEAHEAALLERDTTVQAREQEIRRLELLVQEQSNKSEAAQRAEQESRTSWSAREQQLLRQVARLQRERARSARARGALSSRALRERQLAEYCVQLRLGEQRTRLRGAAARASEADVMRTVTALENKYKDIVASVQAAAIKRRLQDQLSLQDLVRACGAQERGDLLHIACFDAHDYSERREEMRDTFGSLVPGPHECAGWKCGCDEGGRRRTAAGEGEGAAERGPTTPPPPPPGPAAVTPPTREPQNRSPNVKI